MVYKINISNYHLYSVLFVLALLILSCKRNDKNLNSVEEFDIAGNNIIEQVADKKLVKVPVAISQDKKGRLWVVEMPGYMRDLDGNGEEIADGRIVILSDKNNDGLYDNRSVILDNLLNPRAILLAFGGILYTDGNALIFSELNDDQILNKTIIDSLYINGGNIEYRPNGLYYNIDNWIYSAVSKTRYQYANGEWKKEATAYRGQWGMSSDDTGRLVYNHNSAPILGDVHMPNTLHTNPYLKVKYNLGNLYTADMRVYPSQSTSVNRGYEDGVLDEDGKLTTYTSSCAPHVYYGSALSTEYDGNIFVCAPEINAISRFNLNHYEQTAEKNDTTREFLYSTDETFRPINLMTGYDDCLYIVDLRKGIIQHSAYMSSYLREKIVEKGLESVTGLGNIYRVRNKGQKFEGIILDEISDDNLPKLFTSENFATRLFAQREIIFKNLSNITPKLKDIVRNPTNGHQLLHALWTLDGLQKLDAITLLKLKPNKIESKLWVGILPLIKKHLPNHPEAKSIYKELISKNDSIIDLQLAPYLGSYDNSDLWEQIAYKYPFNSKIAEALASGIMQPTVPRLKGKKLPSLRSILEDVEKNVKAKSSQLPTIDTKPSNDTRTNGLQIFRQNCASCHGRDGNGQKLMAPGLTDSEFLQGPESNLVEIIFNGYDSGKEEYQIKMPAYIENKQLSDQDISDLIDYLLSTFARRWGGIKTEDIAKIRSNLKNKQ